MKLALAFSGGKDSWACLWLNKERLSDITVLWVNTGKNYPEALRSIAAAREMCPHFVEIEVDRDAQNAQHGIPSEVVPVDWTDIGQLTSGTREVKVQSYIACCYENIALPLINKALELGITHMIRGQRNDEPHKATSRNGQKILGVTFLHPIEDWSRQRVLDFVAAHMRLPDHFSLEHSSMDCYDCTAFTRHSVDRIAYTREHHPVFFAEYSARKAAVDGAIRCAMGVN